MCWSMSAVSTAHFRRTASFTLNRWPKYLVISKGQREYLTSTQGSETFSFKSLKRKEHSENGPFLS